MWQKKYASAVPKNLGVGVNFGCAVKAISSPGVRSLCYIHITKGTFKKIIFTPRLGVLVFLFFLLAGQTELGEVASKWCTLLGVVEKEPTREARGDKVGRRVHSSKAL